MSLNRFTAGCTCCPRDTTTRSFGFLDGHRKSRYEQTATAWPIWSLFDGRVYSGNRIAPDDDANPVLYEFDSTGQLLRTFVTPQVPGSDSVLADYVEYVDAVGNFYVHEMHHSGITGNNGLLFFRKRDNDFGGLWFRDLQEMFLFAYDVGVMVILPSVGTDLTFVRSLSVGSSGDLYFYGRLKSGGEFGPLHSIQRVRYGGADGLFVDAVELWNYQDWVDGNPALMPVGNLKHDPSDGIWIYGEGKYPDNSYHSAGVFMPDQAFIDVGSGNGVVTDLRFADGSAFFTDGHYIYRYSLAGAFEWSFFRGIGGTIGPQIAVNDAGECVFHDRGPRKIVCLNPDGSEKWRRSVPNPTVTADYGHMAATSQRAWIAGESRFE